MALPVAAMLILATNIAGIIQNYPYGLSYYNPLLGGAAGARADMMLGWGEGLDQIGDAINDLPDAAEVRVATTAWISSTFVLPE